jgi:hypothetical protein
MSAMDDDELSDDMVTLTRTQWQELMGSIQQLSEANAMLARTIACLLQRVAQACDQEAPARKAISDPYDLNALRRMINEVE